MLAAGKVLVTTCCQELRCRKSQGVVSQQRVVQSLQRHQKGRCAGFGAEGKLHERSCRKENAWVNIHPYIHDLQAWVLWCSLSRHDLKNWSWLRTRQPICLATQVAGGLTPALCSLHYFSVLCLNTNSRAQASSPNPLLGAETRHPQLLLSQEHEWNLCVLSLCPSSSSIQQTSSSSLSPQNKQRPQACVPEKIHLPQKQQKQPSSHSPC